MVSAIAGWADSIAYIATSESSSGRSPSPAHAAAHAAVSGVGAAPASPPTAAVKRSHSSTCEASSAAWPAQRALQVGVVRDGGGVGRRLRERR